MSKKKKISGKVVAASAIVAAGAGYLAGILTAPKSGKDTRKDISKKASKAKIEGEKQLKNLHSELNDTIKEVDDLTKRAKIKVTDELNEANKKAKVARDKSKEILSALHHGDADDPNLKAVIKEATAAKNNLVKYLKK